MCRLSYGVSLSSRVSHPIAPVTFRRSNPRRKVFNSFRAAMTIVPHTPDGRTGSQVPASRRADSARSTLFARPAHRSVTSPGAVYRNCEIPSLRRLPSQRVSERRGLESSRYSLRANIANRRTEKSRSWPRNDRSTVARQVTTLALLGSQRFQRIRSRSPSTRNVAGQSGD